MSANALLQTDVKTVPLFDIETSTMSMEPGITTVTFFKGDPKDFAVKIRDRFQLVAQANPWVLGHIVKNKEHKNYQLIYPAGQISEDLIDQAIWKDPAGLSIDPSKSYLEIAASVTKSKAGLPFAFQQSNKKDLVTRITIASDSTNDSAFGLIFSMCHMAVDGYTYYSIMNMLSSDGEISILTPTRNAETEVRMKETCKADMDWLTSAGLVCRSICSLVCEPKTKIVTRKVDNAKINAAKALAKEQGAEFVSTNDILTSNFGNITSARALMMPINHRGYIEGATPAHAGNYQGVLVIDKGYFGNPAGIRQILKTGAPYQCRKQDLPKFCETACGKVSFMTNLNEVAKGLRFPGCEQVIQFPMYDPTMMPNECAIIFRSKPEETCVMYFTHKYDDKFFSEKAPVGDVASQSIFG